MLRDITIGQYYKTDSILHKLDPRVKLFGTLVFLVTLFMSNNVVSYVLAALFVAVVIKLSNVPLKFIFKGLKSIVFILLFSVSFTLFFMDGERILFEFGIIRISVEGLIKSLEIMVRLILMIIGTSIITLTTTPNDIADGLEKAFGFLKVIKVPVHEIAMMVSIAFRFIPILLEETDKIIKAQSARGANFDEGGLIQKAKGMVPIIVPLLVSSIRRALDLATAMEARCYRGGEGRTKMKPLKYKTADYITYVVYALYFAVFILIKVFI